MLHQTHLELTYLPGFTIVCQQESACIIANAYLACLRAVGIALWAKVDRLTDSEWSPGDFFSRSHVQMSMLYHTRTFANLYERWEF